MSNCTTKTLISNALERIRTLERTGHVERALEARRVLEDVQEEHAKAMVAFKSALTELIVTRVENMTLEEEIIHLLDEAVSKAEDESLRREMNDLLDQASKKSARQHDIQDIIVRTQLVVDQRRHDVTHLRQRIGALVTSVDT